MEIISCKRVTYVTHINKTISEHSRHFSQQNDWIQISNSKTKWQNLAIYLLQTCHLYTNFCIYGNRIYLWLFQYLVCYENLLQCEINAKPNSHNLKKKKSRLRQKVSCITQKSQILRIPLHFKVTIINPKYFLSTQIPKVMLWYFSKKVEPSVVDMKSLLFIGVVLGDL